MGADVTLTPIDLVEQRLRERVPKVHRRGDTIEACCPAHEDNNPSLSIGVGTKGRDIVVKCHAGCNANDVLRALDLRWTDFGTGERIPTDIYNYVDADGTVMYRVLRMPDKQFLQQHMTPTGEWAWNIRGIERILYRLPQVLAAVAGGETVYVVEGEKDADRMRAAGVTATTNSGGAEKMTWGQTAPLAGANVVIVADRDERGRAHARQVRDMLAKRGCTVRTVEAITGKDAFDHLAAGHGVDDFAPLDLDMCEPIEEPAPEIDDNDWAPIDLTGIASEFMAGTRQPTLPTVMAVEGALPLFYGDGRINSIYGESGSFKTFLAAAAVREMIQSGRRALYVDYEDHAAGLAERLVLLGCTLEQIALVDYRNPTTGLLLGLVAIEGDDDGIQ